MKYYIIAGESSGDLHGANLMKAIKDGDANAQFRYWGGDAMATVAKGCDIHIRETAIMGFAEVVKNLSKIKGFFKTTKAAIAEYQPDVIVFIDYPGFNLRMAKWAKENNFKTVFYISPQLWAWKSGRKETIRKYIDELIVIIPFEKDWYAAEGINAHYVGHPLMEAIAQYDYKSLEKTNEPILAILPGSRVQEVKKMLPVMLEAATTFEDQYQITIAGSDTISPKQYSELIGSSKVEVIIGRTYDVLEAAKLALVTSGTATLETALHEVPQIVCYKTSGVNYAIGKRLVKLEYISLVNLILGEEAVPELIQNELTKENILKKISFIDNNRNTIIKKYKTLQQMLKTKKTASASAAEIIINLTEK